MWTKITLIIGLLALYLVGMLKLYQAGKKSEQLERLKREIKSRSKADEIIARTINLNSTELNDRVQDKRKRYVGSMRTKD